MYLLVIILDKAKDLENIIRKFREIGVTGATIFDSVGVGKTTLYGSTEVIASLKRIFDPETRAYNHTILSVIRTKETLDAAIGAAQQICGDFTKPDVGLMFTIKLDQVIGFSVSGQSNEEG